MQGLIGTATHPSSSRKTDVRDYWCMRTDRRQKGYIWSELLEGRLRQGWGYDEKLDLRKIHERLESGEDLSEDQAKNWRGNKRLLPSANGAIKAGDIVVLPNLPEERRWSIVEVTDDEYRFEIDPALGDYGHIRNVSMLTAADSAIHPHSEYVSAKLRGTMRTRLRLWNANRYSREIDELLTAISEGADVGIPASEAKHLLAVHEALGTELWSRLEGSFRGERFEGPVKKVLEHVYDDVEHVGGRSEKGADLLCSFHDDLGFHYRVAVQVKMWDGEGDVSGALGQIRRACKEHENISAGLVLTTLTSLTDGTEEAREQLEGELNRPIAIMLRDEVVDLFLRHIPDIVQGLEPDDPM